MNISEIKELLLGMPFSDASKYLESVHAKYRVRRNNGICNELTCDHRHDRINLTINNNIVTYLDIG